MSNQEDTLSTTRELDLLTRIAENPDISQANLASELGIAVGTVNWYLKRLVSKGYVKVKRAQRKKLRYIITPEGIALRTRLTVDYIQSSFELYRHTRQKTLNAIMQLRENGFDQVRIEGDGEIAEVCRLTCLENSLPVTDDPTAPCIVIDGIHISLALPAESIQPKDSATLEPRGERGSTD
ncbi:MAG: Putative DNA-binding protein [Anaerolineae bacterium 49_20]|jgi:DNA-binding MarR family transcriptional regulator|nr:MAG: Putative DNA-binding protein [Anaerolineae bacterium 49_20]